MKDIFGNEVKDIEAALKLKRPPNLQAVKAHAALIAFTDAAPAGMKCKHCQHMIVRQYGRKRVFKCQKSKITAGQESDWRSNWQACGYFEKL